MANLMRPLFYNGMFNREGKRIRSNYLKSVTDGENTYNLWIDDGKPNRDYVSNEKDQYYLYLEHNGYLINTGLTEYQLEERAGHELINDNWYGGNEKNRTQYYQENFYKGRTYTEYRPLVKKHIDKENAFIQGHPELEAMQVKLLKKSIDTSIQKYINARDNDGNFADFVGALFLDELETCVELALVLSEKIEQEWQEREKLQKEAEEQKRKKQEAIENKLMQETEEVFISGGEIKDSEIIVKLADKYDIEIPIRTRGWILNSLTECTLTENGNISYQYWRKTKNSKGSQTAFRILRQIQETIKAKLKEEERRKYED